MTGEDRGIDRQGIYISPETAEQEAVPEELNADLVGDYRFPDPRRRRVAAWIYTGLAAGLLAATFISPRPWWIGGIVAAGLAVWHWLAAWPLEIDQEEALAIAASRVEFPVGHASAAVSFAGVRARPRWQVIVYSAENPPTRRALVQLDAVDGSAVGDIYSEAIEGSG